MAKKQTIKERTVIEQVRDLMPRRALLMTEAYSVAERQAYKLLDLLDLQFPHVTYDKLLSLPNIEIKLEPDYRMTHFSGISRFSHGNRLILIDKCKRGPRNLTFDMPWDNDTASFKTVTEPEQDRLDRMAAERAYDEYYEGFDDGG